MRFPFSLTRSMALYMLRKKISGQKKFPLVLMLEPLHSCNLHCSGCGRIREYADTINKHLTVAECLNSVTECDSPIVSLCGGEPLLYPEIVELVDRILRLGKHIYLCTNGQFLENRLSDFIQLSYKNRRTKRKMFWNVHLDGSESLHDAIVEKPGAFVKAVNGITAAKKAGFYVYTNTTLYKKTEIAELTDLARQLEQIGIDGMMLAPGYGYESVSAESFFLTREETYEKFKSVRKLLGQFRMTATPIYLDFLCGERKLPCAAWANPTRNIKGWKSPCYLVTDRHYATYRDFIELTDWSRIGHGNDPRCEHCMMHCGFEPAAVLFGNRLRDLIRLAIWQIS
ncbi:MAG: adenosyl-hopene transferase HpnH [Planctomycetaceae bacterium]|jgi:hopanoid biosynthesis associated radical SAM protein HpnH|nr:adenosyl-hopene transferase HpnH [Planctomycetaceae bacterium]